MRFGDAFVYEGETTEITEEVVNDKGFPLPALEIRFALDRNLSYLRESAENASLSDKNYRRDVFSLFSRQKKIRTFALSCEKRGYYRIDEAELVGYDYFFSEKNITRPSRSTPRSTCTRIWRTCGGFETCVWRSRACVPSAIPCIRILSLSPVSAVMTALIP